MRKITWLAALAVVALVAGACGGDAVEGTSTTTVARASTSTTGAAPSTTGAPTTTESAAGSDVAAFRTALETSSDVQSGRMEGTIEILGAEGTPAGTTMTMGWSGAFDNSTGAFSFTMDLGSILEQAAAAGEEIPPGMAGMFDEIEMRTVGDTSYIRFPFFSAFLGVDTDWISMPADEAGGATGSFSFGASPANPADLLAAFGDAGAEIDEIGRETVRGVETTHYRVLVDMQTLADQVDPDELAELEDLGPLPFDELPLDVWIGDDGLVRRFAMDIDGSTVQAAAGEGFERMIMTFELFDLGEPVTVEAPPESQVTDVSTLEFNPFADVS